MNKRERQIEQLIDKNGPLTMYVKSYDSLDIWWKRRYPEVSYSKYHQAIKRLEGQPVTAYSIVLSGAVMLKESSVVFGEDVLLFEDEYISPNHLESELFEI